MIPFGVKTWRISRASLTAARAKCAARCSRPPRRALGVLTHLRDAPAPPIAAAQSGTNAMPASPATLGPVPMMVDVASKAPAVRVAIADAVLRVPPAAVRAGAWPTGSPSALAALRSTAVVAGVLGAKRVGEFIPMCHPLPLDGVVIEILEERADAASGAAEPAASTSNELGSAPLARSVTDAAGALGGLDLRVVCAARTTARTGVEMEALTGASIAALTLYDMLKAAVGGGGGGGGGGGAAGSSGLVVERIRLLAKAGGKSD
jgi:cyclic pyranopterin monophosphate synthase